MRVQELIEQPHICTCGDCSPSFADRCRFEQALGIACEGLEKYAALPGPAGSHATDSLGAVAACLEEAENG